MSGERALTAQTVVNPVAEGAYDELRATNQFSWVRRAARSVQKEANRCQTELHSRAMSLSGKRAAVRLRSQSKPLSTGRLAFL